MIVLQTFSSGPEPCEYLPDRTAMLEYEVVAQMSGAEYEARMNAGWRKFGRLLFHPVCGDCRACRPIRIPVERFAPDRAQQRTLRRGADLEVRFDYPTVDDERLGLYHRYHDAQTRIKGWPATRRSAEEYFLSFIDSPIPVVEITVREEGRLLAVVIADITPGVVSGVYHYHDPEQRSRSLGTFAMLQTIELARRLGRPWAYFGFYVAGCPSMEYKARFRPCQLLDEDGAWRDAVGLPPE